MMDAATYMPTSLRRTVQGVMVAAVGMILIALLVTTLYFKHVATDAANGRAAVVAALADANAKLDESTLAIASLNAFIQDSDGARARALTAAVKQVTDAQQKLITELFARERATTKAEAERQLAAIRAAQADLEKKISAIVSGPAGPPGAPGPKGQCQLLCL